LKSVRSKGNIYQRTWFGILFSCANWVLSVLQRKTINYLKENPETTSAFSKILVDNKDSLDEIIKPVFVDIALTTAAVD